MIIWHRYASVGCSTVGCGERMTVYGDTKRAIIRQLRREGWSYSTKIDADSGWRLEIVHCPEHKRKG